MSLDVYLGAQRVGVLWPVEEGGCGFAYAAELVERAALGEGWTTPLSLSLPIRPEPYRPEETAAYLEGLLPEGKLRERVAAELDVDPADTFALLALLGHDCPGAVVFLPEGSPPPRHDAHPPDWLSANELGQLVRSSEPPTHATLPGERRKLALARSADGKRWALPSAAHPSTHILIPETGKPKELAVNQMACTTAMRITGIPVVHTELTQIAGRRCLASRRFDRWGAGDAVQRIHQESFCQALRIPADSDEGRSLPYHASLQLLRAIGEEGSVGTLFAAAFCNYLFGNDDSIHGRQAALLYTDDGPLLAPFTGLTSPAVYWAPQRRREQRSMIDLAHRQEKVPTLAPSLLGCDPELLAVISDALQTAGKLSNALYTVGQQARREGWHTPLVDNIPPRTIPFSFDFDIEDILRRLGENDEEPDE